MSKSLRAVRAVLGALLNAFWVCSTVVLAHTRSFWGVYAVGPFRALPKGKLDFYYLGLDRKRARFNEGVGRELRHSIGARIWGKTESWDYNTELV